VSKGHQSRETISVRYGGFVSGTASVTKDDGIGAEGMMVMIIVYVLNRQ